MTTDDRITQLVDKIRRDLNAVSEVEASVTDKLSQGGPQNTLLHQLEWGLADTLAEAKAKEMVAGDLFSRALIDEDPVAAACMTIRAFESRLKREATQLHRSTSPWSNEIARSIHAKLWDAIGPFSAIRELAAHANLREE